MPGSGGFAHIAQDTATIQATIAGTGKRLGIMAARREFLPGRFGVSGLSGYNLLKSRRN